MLPYVVVDNKYQYFRDFLMSGMLMRNQTSNVNLHIIGWEAQHVTL